MVINGLVGWYQVRKHRAAEADVTVGCLLRGEARISSLGVMRIDDDMNIKSFAEKISGDALLPYKVR